MVVDDCCKSDTDGDCLVTVRDDVEETSPALTTQFNQTHSEFTRKRHNFMQLLNIEAIVQHKNTLGFREKNSRIYKANCNFQPLLNVLCKLSVSIHRKLLFLTNVKYAR